MLFLFPAPDQQMTAPALRLVASAHHPVGK
jgi:hypothetical protein